MSDLIPSRDEVDAIRRQARRFASMLRQFLDSYPDGRAPCGSNSTLTVAMLGLTAALTKAGFGFRQVHCPYGWPEAVCDSLVRLALMPNRFRTWGRHLRIMGPDDDRFYPTHFQFDPAREGQALAELERLLGPLSETYLEAAHEAHGITPAGATGGRTPEREGHEARMKVDRESEPPTITLDGQPYPVDLEQAVFVEVLLSNLGRWVEPATFDQEAILMGSHRDRIKKKLPKPVCTLIKGKPGGGYKMTLA